MKPVILASGSAPRKKALADLGIPFIVEPSNVSEQLDSHWSPEEAVVNLALRKVRAVSGRRRERKRVIVGFDTVVALGQEIFGKPSDVEDARSVLARLRGRRHRVLTGVAAIETTLGRTVSGWESSWVEMRLYSDKEVDEYLASGEPMGRAGSYAFQGLGRALVAKHGGGVDNITGLPVRLLRTLLADVGYAACDSTS